MEYYLPILGTLCVWRITHLLNVELGPWNLMSRLRRVAGNGFFGKLLGCFYCLSLWTAAPFGLWLGGTWTEKLLLWLAMSAGAILLERVTNREDTAHNTNQTAFSNDGSAAPGQDDLALSSRTHTRPNTAVNSRSTADTLQN
jgi:hypothetical protein